VDPGCNPCSPGAGRRPAALVGRDTQLNEWRVELEHAEAGGTAQPMVLSGLRDVGKTVLLAEFARLAADRGWIVARLDGRVGTSLREAVGNALHGPLADLARPSAGERLWRALKTMASFRASVDRSGTWNFGLDLSGVGGGGADTGVLEVDLTKVIHDVAAAAAEDGKGLAVLVDEAQDVAGDELAALCSTVHAASQDGWALTVGLAGLPSLPRILAEAKSYSERLFSFHTVGNLAAPLAAQVLTGPAAAEPVEWEDAAVERVVAEAGGYPYFLRQFGQDTWNETAGPSILQADARVGIEPGHGTLDNGFFRTRWDRATPAEQRYLRAMAVDGDAGSTSSNVAKRLNRKITSLGPTRASLIAKGLIYSLEHGVVAFTVPGMADFIRRQPNPEQGSEKKFLGPPTDRARGYPSSRAVSAQPRPLRFTPYMA
jgi:hypothetical protein